MVNEYIKNNPHLVESSSNTQNRTSFDSELDGDDGNNNNNNNSSDKANNSNIEKKQ